MFRRQYSHLFLALILTSIVLGATASPLSAEELQTSLSSSALKNSQTVSTEVDRLIADSLKSTGEPVAPLTTDEDFLRRVTFDLIGKAPTPNEVTLFALNPDPQKRQKLIETLLADKDYARNWARYWRDVIFARATDQRSRISQGIFEEWMTEQLEKNASWSDITKEILTATGDVRKNGATALIFAQEAEAANLAAETSRIFLGIQLQCANCHDHPTDIWKREQFHQLAAFFPRMAVRPVRMDNGRSFEVVSVNVDRNGNRGQVFRNNPEFVIRRFDKNGDGKLTKEEYVGTQIEQIFRRIAQVGDANKDGAISAEELKNLPAPQMQRGGDTEYHMPDLNNPGSKGKRIDPVFFVSKVAAETELRDLERRTSLVDFLTSKENPWYARAFVNRTWNEMLGQGFYMPVDDMGPERVAEYPEVLELLSAGFTANNYDIQWLHRTITNTETYQRKIRPKSSVDSPAFASATPTRLRSDQLFNALTQTLGTSLSGNRPQGRGNNANNYRGRFGARQQFNNLFGNDPSTPQEEITGDVPQALFLMNSPLINNLIRGDQNTRLGQLLKRYSDNDDAIAELYLLVLAREPSPKEMSICNEYLTEVNNRTEAFEDLMWSLINSSEFLSKR